MNRSERDFHEDWLRFFSDLQLFINTIKCHNFCEYATERLEMWMSMISELEYLLSANMTTITQRMAARLDNLSSHIGLGVE